MIIRTSGNNLYLITQPDHAGLAAAIAAAYRKDYFRGISRYEEVQHAVLHHDDCWTQADQQILIHAGTGLPYSFDDYPAGPKIRFYQEGIDHIARYSGYAGLLCSLHFAWFFREDRTEAGRDYYLSEQARQENLKKELQITGEAASRELDFHFRLLQFCDNLSLYICLNEPGCARENEFPWFKNGFSHSRKLTPLDRTIRARWKTPAYISVEPFPFRQPFAFSILYKKLDIRSPDLPAAFRRARPQSLKGTIGPE